MPRRAGWLVGLIGSVLGMVLTAPVQAGTKKIEPTNKWTGTVADKELRKKIPELGKCVAACITNTKELDNLWKAWKFGDAPPSVDFTKEIVLVGAARSQNVWLSLRLEDTGNLRVGIGEGALVARDGFGYRIVAVSRSGIKTVNGKKLAK